MSRPLTIVLRRISSCCLVLTALMGTFRVGDCIGAGLTVITHGYSGNADDWVTAMANAIPSYPSFPGTSFTIYKITLTTDGNGSYYYQSERTNGVPAGVSDSGEIIVKLDWSQMAGGISAPYDISTYDVAAVASWVFQQTNAIAELGGHALAELPVHLIGHSRGGSLVNEISRLLGTNGVWVDHLTSLDPHPLNNDGNFDLFLPTDASADETYANVFYRDNFWQNFPGGLFDFNGESASGAYNRQLTDLSGGYNDTAVAAPNHSNVHLWYHGTISWATPTSDGGASITNSQRQAWWTADEQAGTNAGFEYSLIGGASRLSTEQPVGPGSPAVSDGLNQRWNFGLGASDNRASLSSNSGEWPNVILCNVTGTNVVTAGEPVALKFYYQYGGSFSNAACQIYFDQDANPYDSNETLAIQGTVTNTGVGSVRIVNVTLDTSTVAPGIYRVVTKISRGGHTRYSYAPEVVRVLSNRQPPLLQIANATSDQVLISVHGVSGQTVILEASRNLQAWVPLATNTLSSNTWIFTNGSASTLGWQFYRGVQTR